MAPGTESVILVVAAHPDDIDFGAAGTVAKWTSGGAVVSYLLVTDGDAGGTDRDLPRAEMATIRRAEQRAAAKEVGVNDVEFLGRPDGRVVADLELRCAVARSIRRHRPDLVMCPSPDRDYSRLFVSHPDHLAVGEAALCAVYPDARNPFAFPELLQEGLEPHSVGEVWMVGSPHPDHVVDITDFIDAKCAALGSHASQLSDVRSMLENVRARSGELARSGGLGDGCYAEIFKKITVPT